MNDGPAVEKSSENDSSGGPEPVYPLAADVAIDGGGAECTLWPADAPVEELTTAWITALESAFVSLPEMR